MESREENMPVHGIPTNVWVILGGRGREVCKKDKEYERVNVNGRERENG